MIRLSILLAAILLNQLDSQITRLRPLELSSVPAGIAQQLENRGCLIPVMTYGGASKPNVTRGRFATADQQDWAVLCSQNGRSSILIIWGGKHSCSSEFNAGADENYVQGDADKVMRFSRLINVIGPNHLRKHFQQSGQVAKFPIAHDGLVDRFEGKASTIYYCHAGKWEELEGSD